MASGPAVYPDKVEIRGYKPSTGVHIGQLKKGYKLLKAAKKPLFLIGGGVNAAKANKELLELVERTQIPVVTTIMGKGAIPTSHPLYVGNSGMHGRYAANLAVSECDVLFSIGTRFNDRITGDLNEFAPNAKIVHVDIDTASISRNVVVDVPIVADAKLAIQRLLEWAEPQKTEKWRACIAQWEEENPLQMRRDRGLTPQMIMEGINQEFDEGIIVTDVGQHQMWAAQNYTFKEPRTFLSSGGLGTMGYGVGAAIGAKYGRPDKTVINIAGDGCFRMNLNEIATAARYNVPIIQVVLNNHVLGMVRQWQTLFYDHRYSNTVLDDSVDFVKVAEGLGAMGIRANTLDEFEAAMKTALTAGRPVVIDVTIAGDDKVWPMVAPGAAIDTCFSEDDM